ncbi:MAG: DUF3010 family protein [Pontibacterium sp.]
MRICGVDISGSDAVITLLGYENGLFDIPDCRARQLSLSATGDQEAVKRFRATFAKLVDDYRVDTVAIRQRPHKGKFAGSAVGFKMEALIELLDCSVTLISPTDIKEQIKRNPLPIDFAETGLKKFQEQAFMTAYAKLNQTIYSSSSD